MTRPRQPSVGAVSRFPDPRFADADGLVAVGGHLDPEWLLDAYRHGLFPWPSDPNDPMLWWSPDPRAVMPLAGMHVSRRLRRRLRRGEFEMRCNTSFAGVIDGCATAPGRQGGTWITPTVRRAYLRMHKLGHAHSVEAWTTESGESRLVGGLYGVAIGGLFAAESMFHYRTDASKAALAALVAHLNSRGYLLLDIQQWTNHTGSLGAVEMSRSDYLNEVRRVIDLPIGFGDRLEAQDW